MKALLIPAVILLVLFLLGQIRIGGRAQYSETGAFLWLRIGGVNIQMYPSKPKGEKKPKQKKPAKDPEAEKVGTLEKAGGIVYLTELTQITPSAASTLRRAPTAC